jgi:hypothetical protein
LTRRSRARAHLNKDASEGAPIAKPPQRDASAKIRGKTVIQQDIKAANAGGSSCLFIGQNRQGQWVVRDARSVCGGLFENRTEAIRFAMYECQRRPQSVIMLPDGLELDLGLGGDLNVSPNQRAA